MRITVQGEEKTRSQMSNLNSRSSSVGFSEANTDSPTAAESEEFGQNVVILMEADQELQLNPRAEQVELKAERVVASYPINPGPSRRAELNAAEQAFSQFSINTARPTESLQAMHEVSSPADLTVPDPERPTALMSVTTTMTETYAPPQSASSPPTVYSDQSLKLTFNESEHESATVFPGSPNEVHMQTQTVPNANHTIEPRLSELAISKLFKEVSHRNNFDFGKAQDNPREREPNPVQEESQTTPTPAVLEKQKEKTERPAEVYLSTQAFQKVDGVVSQVAQTTASLIIAQTIDWEPLDGSGVESQGLSNKKKCLC